MDVRVSDEKNKDKPTWPEHLDKINANMPPTMATIVEKGSMDGKPCVLLTAHGPGKNLVTFRLSQDEWSQINVDLINSKERWAKERKDKLKP